MLEFNVKNVIFNIVHPNPSNVINAIVLSLKQYIYRQRCLKNPVQPLNLTSFIKELHNIELHVAKESGKLLTHYSKWAPFY